MDRRPACLVLTFVVAAAVVVVPPSAASDGTPLYTDPRGDASLARCAGWDPQVCPEPVSEPSIDVVSGDVASADGVLRKSVTVLDLNAPSAFEKAAFLPQERQYRSTLNVFFADRRGVVAVAFCGSIDGGRRLYGRTDAAFVELDSWEILHPCASESRVEFTADYATNTVEFALPLAELQAIVAAACPDCPAVGVGTTVNVVGARTEFIQHHLESTVLAADDVHVWRDYVIGQD